MESESEASVQEIYTAMHIKTSRFRVLVTFLQFRSRAEFDAALCIKTHSDNLLELSIPLGYKWSMVQYGGVWWGEGEDDTE